MAKYKTLWEAEIESTHKEADDSGKMIQVLVRTDDKPHISIRDAYKGPAGNFLNNPPTYNPDEEVEEELIEILPQAFRKGRIYKEALKQFQDCDEISDERAIGLLDLIDEYDDITQILELVEA
ncbi:hypothetical protein [Natronobiforma cellulositropha]|uniref:hypothetical protein n=1 Tax=Natronobiforma cellulositropha TaxID=1679076 RepID=UPI0021D5CFD4|nr:hypothetical protein [Natronobiforma cellulositropha]